MKRLPVSLIRLRAPGPMRWALLVAVTGSSLALLAQSNDAADVAAAPASAAASTPATRSFDAIHDPGARLGATFEPLSPQAALHMGLAAGTALAVVDVQPDSQAARAGLLADDVITAIAGPVSLGTAAGPTTTATWDALCDALDERTAGGALDFFVRRDGRTRIVHVQIEALDAAARSVAEATLQSRLACA